MLDDFPVGIIPDSSYNRNVQGSIVQRNERWVKSFKRSKWL